MQSDMFGDFSEPAVREVSPPVLLPAGSWVPPETLAFNIALRNGVLADAIAILKPLGVPALASVLLASGFSVPATKDRRLFLSLVQSDIVAAAQLRMTGNELLDARREEKKNQAHSTEDVPFNPGDYAIAFLSMAEVGDFITDADGFNYVIDSLNDPFIHPTKIIRAIRPLGTSKGDAGLGFMPAINRTRSPRLTPNEAKLAKKRYEVEEEKAVKHNSPVLATSSGFSSFIRENSELAEGQLIRLNDSIYEIHRLRGEVPYSEVVIKRPGTVGIRFQDDLETTSISHGEARSARRAFFPQVASFDMNLSKSLWAGAFSDVVDLENAINLESAGELNPGAIVVDESGTKYLAFSARFGYLEAFPFGSDGKPAVFAGNSIFFHVDPATASAYPERRHDPVFLINEISLDSSNGLMQHEVIDDAVIAAKKEGDHDAGIDGSKGLRAGIGAENRGDGVGGGGGGEPLDVGMARSSHRATEGGVVSGVSGGSGEPREGHSGERNEFSPSVAAGNLADVRDQRSASSGGVNGVLNTSSSSARSLTRQELNSLLVTDMSDEQLLQANEVFAGSRRSESIERQIQKRGLVQATGALASVTVDADKKTVQLPTVVSEAIAADMHAQKARSMRLESIAKRQGTTLKERLALQDKAQSASVALRNMRSSIFAAEDAAVLAIEAGQVHLFHAHAGLFPKTFASISAHVVSLGAAAAPAGTVVGWDGLSVGAKTDVLKLAGWATGAGELNFVGKRLLNEAWADIHKTTKATLARNMVSVGVWVGAGGVASVGNIEKKDQAPTLTVGMAFHRNLGAVEIDGVCLALQAQNPDSTSVFVRHEGEIKEVTIHEVTQATSAAPVREFRDPDKLNALVNPILDGDWFKLGEAEWQARNGYSGRGWSLVKDRALHPQVRNFDSQVGFMRSVIEAAQLARVAVAPSPAVSVDRDSDVQLLAAARLMSTLTNGRNDIWMLAGPSGVQQRAQVMAALLGREKVTQAEAGVTAIRAEFYKRAGIDTNTTPRGAEVEFQNWVEGVVKPGPVASVSVNSLAAEVPTQAVKGEDGGKKSAEQITAAVANADQLRLLGADRRESILSDLGFAWRMTADEVNDVAEVKAALRSKPNEKAAVEASIKRIERATELFKRELEATAEADRGGADSAVGGATQWAGTSFDGRKEILKSAGYTDVDQARAFSGTEWESLPPPVRSALNRLGRAGDVAAPGLGEGVGPVLAAVADSASVVNTPESAVSNDFAVGLSRADGLEFDSARANSVWIGLSVEAKKEVLKQSGFVNDKGDLSFVGTRLFSEPWKKINIYPKARNGLAVYVAGQSEALLGSATGLNSVNGVGASESFAVMSQEPAIAPVAGMDLVADEAPDFVFAVPNSVRERIQWALARMGDVQNALTGVERARGDGAILAMEWSDQSPNLVRPREILDEFKELALKNGVDAVEFLKSLGGAPDFSRFEAVSIPVEVFNEHPDLKQVQGNFSDVVASLAEASAQPSVGPGAQERSMYPFGKTDKEDRFFGSRVRVMPELHGDTAWEGEVGSVLNSGRLVTVKREGVGDEATVRISGDRLEVLSIKDSQSLIAETDPHIGRTWNSIHGKATITCLLFPKREDSLASAMYEYTAENGFLLRVYENQIEETIKRHEFNVSPEGVAQAAAQKIAYEKAEADRAVMDAKIAEIKAHDDAKLQLFLSSTDYPAIKIGQAKKSLLAPVRLEGNIMKSYEFAEILAGRDLKMEVLMEDRIKPMGRMASFRADNREQAAHEKRIKDAGKKTVRYIGGFEVGAFEFAYAGFVRDQLNLERAAGVTEPEIDRRFTGAPSVDAPAVDGALASLEEDDVEIGDAGGWSAKTHILIVADDVSKLRAGDVLRLFEELPKSADRFDDLRVYIVENRPDLLSAVVDALDEVGVPAREAQLSISDEDHAVRKALLLSKGQIVKEYLAYGGTVDVVTRVRVSKLHSPDQIKIRRNGVYVPEGHDKDSADGLRWAFLVDSQVDALLAQVPTELLPKFQQAGANLPGALLDEDARPLGQWGEAVEAEEEILASVSDQGIEAEAGTEADIGVNKDYSITDEDAIGQGGLAENFRDNVRAIQIVRTLDAEKRDAVGDEKKALARYVGWGGLKGVFNPANKQWARQHVELRALLSDAEWDAASRSQLDAHYTSPTVVNAMYSALARLGFENGRVLEPSVGVGNFFGLMPESMRGNSDLHGVELDILTSQIVSALYPSAKISKATGFQDYNVPAGYFDVVIGNPPFGSQSIADNKGSAFSGWSIHNYFFAKSIEMMRPGGIMPMVVSHNFLDKLDPHVRQWIARRAELVSGVRLPNTAFKANANTEVVTDVLIFKRLDYEHSLGKQEIPDWLGTTDVPIENPKTGEIENLAINNYFLKNPQNVLGENSASGSMYKANDYTVLPNGDLRTQLDQWVGSLPLGIYVPLVRSVADLEMSAVEVPEFVKEGSFYLQGAEVWQRLSDLSGQQRAVKWDAPNSRALERMAGMIEIRDSLRSQMKMERAAQGVTTEMIEDGRKNLNRLYDAFQKANGFLNDPTNRRLFLDDTESALIQALEFDYEKVITASKAAELGIESRPAKAVKADIFTSRVLFPPGEIEVVETAKDALLHSLNYTGGVDMEYMQRAYGKNSSEIVEELGDLLFVDPVEGLVTADLYLSGDVKTKMLEAEKAVSNDPTFSRNIEALRKIIPLDKLPSEIHVTPGSSWVPANVFNEFAREISGGDVNFHYVASTAQWLGHKVNEPDALKNTVDFGTSRMGAMQILNLLMNSRAPEIKEKIDGKYVTDQPATEAVRQRADKIRAHWDSWVWSDHDRAENLALIYNNKFNRTVERKYDGSHLTLPGMSPMIQLLSHQKNGVWRGLQDRTILLDQVVGAGKTYEGIAMLMEMRRLGITKKPLIAVPNHLTLQWRSDFYRLYPGANVLAATPQDFEKDNRERFFSKVVTGNWDAVIVGHSSLKKIPVPLEAETKIIKEQFDDIANAIEELKTSRGDRNAIREMEVIKSNLEAKIVRLKEKGGSKDNVVNFEDIGVDALFVDEMHEFKNLFFTTQMNRVAGLGNPAGSGKAFDMFVKIRWMQDTYGSNAPLITATGTPVSNSLAEMFTMQRYMQYDKLKANDLHVFDAWAKQYGDVQTVYEVAPSGSGYRLSQRFAKFKNLGSLMGEYRSFADVVTLDDLKAQEAALDKSFPVPQIEGGKPLNVVAQRSELQEKFFGIPEIVRDDNNGIKFQVSLETPVKVGKLDDGKFSAMRLLTQRDGNETYQNFGAAYETQEEAAYALALSAVTPVMYVDKNSIVGQFDNLSQLVKESNGKINALSLTSLANKAGLDYRLIDPSAPDFPDSKINKAVSRIVDIGKQWEKDKGTQLIFCDLSVPLSAKSKMANKEKRVYVRDTHGDLTHKLGTLHLVKGQDSVSYFLVADGKAKSKTFTIYDSHTGQLMKEGMDSKSDAHEFVKTILKDDSGLERWLSLQEKSRHIGVDEIDEYKNEKSIDTDADTIDQEITLHDIEGATGSIEFSIYDDMKAKLIANGVPPAQIAFIHDHDTPQSKAFLFKRVNEGDVRYLFGSTPKMGAGTNVQNKLVALHHIDAPWRPSDLEQREGRIIRRGNSLYARDPDGFKIVVNRYATAQTYDTRRWQLLEHKAAGVEQLRKYSGANEIEDVTTEAANSADMKAAASGNPLILKETQLSNDVKKLRLLERAHGDSEYVLNSKMRRERNFAENTGPAVVEKWKSAKAKLVAVAEKGVLATFNEKPLHNKDELMVAMNSIAKSLSAANSVKVLNYKGVDFGFQHNHAQNEIVMTTPVGDTHKLDVFSPSGAVVRMNNWCESIDHVIFRTEKEISYSSSVAADLQKVVGKPFLEADLLVAKIEEHGKVQRALMKSNAVAAVKPEEAVEFKAAVDLQKEKLRAFGLGAAVAELERGDGLDADLDGAAAPGSAALSLGGGKDGAGDGGTDVSEAPSVADSLAPMADDAVPSAVGSVLPGLEAVKARMVDVLSVDAPDGWIVMNAPRPLLGQKTMEGDFVSGRYYAALDPDDSMAEIYLKENLMLDARMLVVVPRDMQMEVALHGNKYRDQYMAKEPAERYKMLSSQLDKLRDLPYGQLSKAIVEAMGVGSEGLHSGRVQSVVAGVAAQRVDRTGTIVHHDVSKLSMPVKEGDVVSITYQGGKGFVSGVGQSLTVGR